MLEVRRLFKTYDGKPLLTDISFIAGEGETICLLGASGSGKSTLLRMIAGLESPDSGLISFDGFDLASTPPHLRDFGLVFQDYALFPHLSVNDNIAFGMRMRRMRQDEIDERVAALLPLVNLDGFENRKVHDLSGGEGQRVALARALAIRPRLLMFDEPLGALDRTLREDLLNELRTILHQTRIPAIYVTHDQEEAMSLADRIVVMEAGKVQQVGSAGEIYRHPGSRFVADFVGTSNFLECRRVDGSSDTVAFGAWLLRVDCRLPEGRERLFIAIRPEMIEVLEGRGDLGGREPGNVLEGIVDAVTFLGAVVRLVVGVSRESFIVDVLYREFERLPVRQGDQAHLYLPPDRFMIYSGA